MTQFIRDTESDLLFHPSVRVYFWGALPGKRMGLTFEPQLLYTAAMFHDVGLTARYENSQLRFEVDGANAARDFLRGHGISESDIETVWNASLSTQRLAYRTLCVRRSRWCRPGPAWRWPAAGLRPIYRRAA